jgi:hypothetical protein
MSASTSVFDLPGVCGQRTLSHRRVREVVPVMQVLYDRCAGIDVHKDQVTVAVRLPGGGPGARQTTVRRFRAFYGVLREMTRWLPGQGVTHVAMEATGIYTMPVYHALRRRARPRSARRLVRPCELEIQPGVRRG